MRAIQQTEWGSLDTMKLVEVPRPEPLPTEVLVRVKAVGVNPIDYHTAVGRGYMNALTLPHIPGWDISGVVEEVGFGTNRFEVGDEVFGFPRFPRAAGDMQSMSPLLRASWLPSPRISASKRPLRLPLLV